jgi:hypothetical protein
MNQYGLGVSEMLAIQTSRTRLAPVLSATLDNRQNYGVPDKYSPPGQLFDHIYFTNQKKDALGGGSEQGSASRRVAPIASTSLLFL